MKKVLVLTNKLLLNFPANVGYFILSFKKISPKSINELNDYYESFGFTNINGQLILKDHDKLKVAYERAWSNSDFKLISFGQELLISGHL